MRLFTMTGSLAHRESGFSLVETLVALTILSTIAVAFLGGISTGSRNVYIADERATGESLARSQMEWAKNIGYSYNATSYDTASIPDSGDYNNYSANITAEAVHDPDDGIQKLIVTITHSGKQVFKLEGYKVDR